MTLGDRIDHAASAARDLKIPGWGHGSAYDCHPVWVRRGALLFLNHWNTHKSGSIYVLTCSDANVVGGCHDPRYGGDPYPKPSEGKLVQVYWAGKWIADGPWQDDAEPVLAQIEAEIEAAQAERKRLADEEAAKRRAERKAHLDSVRQGYQSVA